MTRIGTTDCEVAVPVRRSQARNLKTALYQGSITTLIRIGEVSGGTELEVLEG